jgi:hypothetical protein
MGTMNWADTYGVPASTFQASAPISSAGPNQSTVNPAFSGPGTLPISAGGSGTAPAISLLGMVILLVALRVAIEAGGEV